MREAIRFLSSESGLPPVSIMFSRSVNVPEDFLIPIPFFFTAE